MPVCVVYSVAHCTVAAGVCTSIAHHRTHKVSPIQLAASLPLAAIPTRKDPWETSLHTSTYITRMRLLVVHQGATPRTVKRTQSHCDRLHAVNGQRTGRAPGISAVARR